jgi:hypothetical protein
VTLPVVEKKEKLDKQQETQPAQQTSTMAQGYPDIEPNKSTNPFDGEDTTVGGAVYEDSELTDSVGGGNHDLEKIRYTRGNLISGNVIDAETEIRKSKSRSDVESGSWPPDSDYASRGPKSIWQASSDVYADDTRGQTSSIVTDAAKAEPYGLSKRRKYLRLLLGVTVVVLLVVVVAVALIILSASGDDSKQGPRAVGNERRRALDAIIETSSPPEVLAVEGSPQFLAREWLLNVDELALDPTAGATDGQVIQRYSLAVLYFATGGSNSWGTNDWLAGGECEADHWDFLDCNDEKEVRSLVLGTS